MNCSGTLRWKRGWRVMTIQITKPEVEALIKVRLLSGLFKDAEDVLLHALESSPSRPQAADRPGNGSPARTLQEMFQAVRGLADDVDFGRNASGART
jgi:hypothetical protein